MERWIVVVDDDAMSLKNIKNMLGDGDMKVSCLRSGRELLQFVHNNTPDLILLDLMMPEMDGFETLDALRSDEKSEGRQPIPVIFLTGNNDNETEELGLKAGASDFIRKSFNRDILISRIRNAIDNSKKIESLTEEVKYDKLTGFLSKAHGTDIITKMCENSTGALSILDLDNFKLINDIYGHDKGDTVLMSFAEIIRNNTRNDDIVSRIGGDEFLGFFVNMTEEPAIRSFCERLNEQLEAKCIELLGEGFDIPIGISMGVVFVPLLGTVFPELFKCADERLLDVKQNGKHACSVYEPPVELIDEGEDLKAEMARITKVVEERNGGRGAILLGQDAFIQNYRFMMRFIKRYCGKASKLLFSISPNDSGYNISHAISMFARILQENLRKSDIIMKNKSNQYFLLLPELSLQDQPVVVERILKAWNESGYSDKAVINYHIEILSFEDKQGQS